MERSTKELLGVRIRELRKIMGLTQYQLSGKIGIDAKHISRIEVGRNFPSLNTIDKLANVLKVELKTLFDFDHKVKNTRELKKEINELLKNEDKNKLKLALKVLKALLR